VRKLTGFFPLAHNRLLRRKIGQTHVGIFHDRLRERQSERPCANEFGRDRGFDGGREIRFFKDSTGTPLATLRLAFFAGYAGLRVPLFDRAKEALTTLTSQCRRPARAALCRHSVGGALR
jgi:hypothetical protein